MSNRAWRFKGSIDPSWFVFDSARSTKGARRRARKRVRREADKRALEESQNDACTCGRKDCCCADYEE